MLLRSFNCFPTVSRLNTEEVFELRAQFADQVKCLDSKLDLDVTVMSELHEFYRRRAMVEQEYSEALAKLVNNLKNKHSNETGKRPNWVNYTTSTLWNTLLGTTLRLSDAHATLAEVFGKHMVQRLVDMDEDANRLHKQCREMMTRCQDKVFTNITKLQSDQREYGQRQGSQSDANRICKRSEEKLTAAVNYIKSKKKEPEKSQKFRRAQADYNQKHQAYQNTVLATTRARNEYLIQLCAANQSISRYFTDEVSDILDCMSCGFHNSLARAAMMHLSCEEAVKNCHTSVGEMINRNITALDWRADKSTFLKRNELAFSRPPNFTYLPFKDDTEFEVSPVPPLRDSLAATAADLKANLDQLKTWTEAAWNNLQEIEKRLLVLINQNDYDVSELFANSALSDKRRRQSTSPVCSDEATKPPAPTSPPPPSSSSTASHASLTRGAVASSVGGVVSPLSSSLPPEEGGSKGSVGSLCTEIQPGLYLSMRNTYREQRIKEERIYMERFSAYTQEMHRSVVMQAKLAEIERAFASPQAAVASASVLIPASKHLHLPSPLPLGPPLHTSASPCRLSYDSAPISFGFSGDQGGMAMSMTSSGLPGICPPTTPPPPPLTASSSLILNPAALVKLAPRRVLQVPNVGRPKLFGGTIDEYVTKSGEQIPRVVLSCIRVINLYGMHHQGIFRVPGSQAEINSFKEAFEYGDDPLVGLSEARDINSTAGLLKLYFRELGESPFPKEVFLELVNAVRDRRDSDECVDAIAGIVSKGLSHAVFIVMRYLFAFLHHLSEYSDENMMDPYNLAICFGPTLMPAPPDLDQVEYQASVTDVVKLCINHHRRIFDPAVLGAYYEKFAAYASATVPPVLPRAIAHEAAVKAGDLRNHSVATESSSTHASNHSTNQSGDNIDHIHHEQGFNSSIDQLSLDDGLDDDNDDESDSEIEDFDQQPTQATALANFVGASARELSFNRGCDLLLYRRLNDHWWEGQLASAEPDGPRYLVPHLYVKPIVSVAVAKTTGVTDESSVDDGLHKTGSDSPLSCSPERNTERSPPRDAAAVEPQVDILFPKEMPVKPCRCEEPKQDVKPALVVLISDKDNCSTKAEFVSTNKENCQKTFSPSADESDTPTALIDVCTETEHDLDEQPTPETQITDSGHLFADADAIVATTDATESSSHSVKLTPTSRTVNHDSSSPTSLLTRSMSNSPASLSPQRRAGNRGSWAGAPSAPFVCTAPTSVMTGLETLPEDKPANIKPSSLRSLIIDGGGDTDNLPATNDVDSALIEVMRGVASLEKDRSQDPDTNSASAERARELEDKMRLPSRTKHVVDLVYSLSERPQPPNWTGSHNTAPETASVRNVADTFAEQTGGTVRKRGSPQSTGATSDSLTDHTHKEEKALATSTSLSTNLGRSESPPKPTSWLSARKLSSLGDGCECRDNLMSKSFITESKDNAIESVAPIKRGSIAARVAAFEASNSTTINASASASRPNWTKKS